MLLPPSEAEQTETAEMQQGTVRLTLAGWQMLEAKITELHDAEVVYAEIAIRMGVVENTLRKLRREKDSYQTNLTDLEGMFQIFNEDKAPDEPQFAPEKRKHYEYVLKETTSTKESKFPLPCELQCFQGREQELQTLRSGFAEGAGKQAIYGLGGMGKTQLALKYALQFWDEYKPVFWVHAETEESDRSRYAEFARSLGLMKRATRQQNKANLQTEEEAITHRQQEQEIAIAAFLRWLDTHINWLLVMDNADTPEFLSAYLPRNPQGHILLTTRTHDLAPLHIHKPLLLKALSEEASLQFFLHRCNRHNANVEERQSAAELAGELGYLPLAMAHAAAYIAYRQTDFAHYLELYREQKLALLELSGVLGEDTHLTSIRATWELNFQALQQEQGAGRAGAYARDLLNFCAFLGADDIPCDLVLSGAQEYCPPLYALLAHPQDGSAKRSGYGAKQEAVYHDLLLPLVRYSLVVKNLASPPRFSIHRMVQLVIAEGLGDAKREWQEWTLQAVDGAFPIPEVENWRLCERLQSHARAVGDIVMQEGVRTQAAGRLLCNLGEFLMCQGQYNPAYSYARYALNMRETFAAEHPLNAEYLLDLAHSLHYLGNICHFQQRVDPQKLDKLEEAQTLLERALNIRLQHPVRNDREITHVRNDLAAVYNSRGLYSQAEGIYRQLLATAETVLEVGANAAFHFHKAALYHNLGVCCYVQKRYPEAVQRYKEALAHWAAHAVKNDPQHAVSWHELAKTYRKMECAEAEECYFHALKIQQKAYPQGHPYTAITLYNIADLYKDTNRYKLAEEYYRKTIAEDIKVFGEIHPAVADDLNALANLYDLMGRQAEADEIRRQAEAIIAAPNATRS